MLKRKGTVKRKGRKFGPEPSKKSLKKESALKAGKRKYDFVMVAVVADKQAEADEIRKLVAREIRNCTDNVQPSLGHLQAKKNVQVTQVRIEQGKYQRPVLMCRAERLESSGKMGFVRVVPTCQL